jgi:hypothetical protein
MVRTLTFGTCASSLMVNNFGKVLIVAEMKPALNDIGHTNPASPPVEFLFSKQHAGPGSARTRHDNQPAAAKTATAFNRYSRLLRDVTCFHRTSGDRRDRPRRGTSKLCGALSFLAEELSRLADCPRHDFADSARWARCVEQSGSPSACSRQSFAANQRLRGE